MRKIYGTRIFNPKVAIKAPTIIINSVISFPLEYCIFLNPLRTNIIPVMNNARNG